MVEQAMSDIKAIETQYKGYRFRSRLEARWAVFFDHLFIKYEYEKEGYQLKSGWYLPDFWLPDYDLWIEIKGVQPSQEEKNLARELHYGTGSLVCIFSGLPEINNKAICYLHDTTDSGGGLWEWGDVAWAICVGCNTPRLTVGKDRDDRIIVRADFEPWKGQCSCSQWHQEHKRIKAACNAAKQARFEHGQKGV